MYMESWRWVRTMQRAKQPLNNCKLELLLKKPLFLKKTEYNFLNSPCLSIACIMFPWISLSTLPTHGFLQLPGLFPFILVFCQSISHTIFESNGFTLLCFLFLFHFVYQKSFIHYKSNNTFSLKINC